MQTMGELIELGFSESVAQAIDIINMGVILYIDEIKEDVLVFDLSEPEVIESKLTFKCESISIPFDEEGFYDLSDTRIEKTENGYSLFDGRGVKINFYSAEATFRFVKSQITLEETAWRSLADFAFKINRKIKFPNFIAPEKSKGLEPLLDELCCLYDYDFAELSDFPVLKSMLPYDKKLYELFDKILSCSNDFKRVLLINKVDAYLSNKKFEASFRSILAVLNESQAEYPDEPVDEIPQKLRELINLRMRVNGYEGEYPKYRKCVKLKGVHFAESKGVSYIVAKENMVIFAQCENYLNDGYGTIIVKASTCFAGKNKEVDELSYLFAKNGKGYFNDAVISYEVDKEGNCVMNPDEQMKVDVICKKSEFKRLSKSEKEASGDKLTLAEFTSTMILWLVMGLFFGLFMTLGFMLFEFIVCLALGELSEFASTFMVTPWWLVFIGSWLGFGGLMGLITAFTKHR